MVEIAEVVDETKVLEDDGDEEFEDEVDSQTVVKKSIVDDSDDDDEFLEEESILERLTALVDIVPPTVRVKLSNVVSDGFNAGLTVAKFLGNGAWIVATSTLLVALPVLMETERETVIIQQELQTKQ
ncbi:mitochondrial outer membrane translocase complex, subunit Tom22 [Globomyces pollinis-pini]|nr:mitochondrial outer membrane translocase complex, subunit Tom22 [Globomyces pollinis-pini]